MRADRPLPDGDDTRPVPHGGVYAALDLGTNNCRLLMAVPSREGFRVVDSYSRIVRLGEGLEATGVLTQEAMDRTIVALHACTARLSRRPIRALRAVATEACRKASNGPAFLARIAAETGIAFQAISPREEAQLAIESCAPLFDPDARRALLFDIGGGSTELAWIRLDGPERKPELIGYTSLPVGVVTLAERYGPARFSAAGFEAMANEVQDRLELFENTHRVGHEGMKGGVQVIGTSGTVTTLAGIALKLARYRRPLIDGSMLTGSAAIAAIETLRAMDREGLARHPCVGADRASFVLPGCAILAGMLAMWPIDRITVADRGLREGILTQLMRQPGPARAERGRHPAHGPVLTA